MKLTRPPLAITEDEGFSSNDIFDRKDFGERLAKLIDKSEENIVIALDAQWGEGKSTFIKMWKGHIAHHGEKKFKSIYFDAFANDYQKDPFLALAAEIYELLKSESKAEKDKYRIKASKALRSLARGALKIGVRSATAGILDGSIVDDVKEDISDLIADHADKVLGDRLVNSVKDKSALDEFKTYLTDLAIQKGEGNPIVFIIDELDRCRPDFALELIEQIKHLFSVKGIVFLLVLSRKQLEASINNRYGKAVDASIYLQKFINLWITLPRKVGVGDYGRKYFRHTLNQLLNDDEKVHNELASQTLEELVVLGRPSYREIEHILAYFALLHNMMGDGKYRVPYQLLVAFICYLKSIQPQLVDLIQNNDITSDKLLQKSGLNRPAIEDPYTIRDLRSYIKFDLASEDVRKDMIEKQEVTLDFGRVPPTNIMVNVCKWLSDIDIDRS